MSLADNYLDLLMRALTRFDDLEVIEPIYLEHEYTSWRRMVARAVTKRLSWKGFVVVRRKPFDAELRRLGRDWPAHADTMIGLERLKNIADLVRTVVADGVPGDLVETGVWRGGGSIMMRAALDAYGDTARTVWCADSFEGLPAPDLDRYHQDAGMTWHTEEQLAVSMDVVQRNFAKYHLLDDRVKFLKGWFKDTLPDAPIEQISVLRLDGDLYASTMDALIPLYDKVSPGGFVIVDDYGIPEDTCRRAIDDFRSQRAISEPLVDVDGWAVYWRKT